MQNIHSSQEKLLVQWYLLRLRQWDFWDDDLYSVQNGHTWGTGTLLRSCGRLVTRVLYSQTTDLRSFYGLSSMVGGYIYIHMYAIMYIYMHTFMYTYICATCFLYICIYIYINLNQTIQDVFKSSLILPPPKKKRRQRCFLSWLLRSACARAEITGGEGMNGSLPMRYTRKPNIDTKKDGLENVSPFKYGHFWYPC